jgi:hypothetical protein
MKYASVRYWERACCFVEGTSFCPDVESTSWLQADFELDIVSVWST